MDERLREAERRWRATRAVEDEGAADLGHAAARWCIDQESPEDVRGLWPAISPEMTEEALRAWTAALGGFDEETYLRAAAACVALVVGSLPGAHEIGVVKAWLACPRWGQTRSFERLFEQANEYAPPPDRLSPEDFAWQTLWLASTTKGADQLAETAVAAARAVGAAARTEPLPDDEEWRETCADAALAEAGSARVRAAVANALIASCLGAEHVEQ